MKQNEIPQIYTAVALAFDKATALEAVDAEIRALGITELKIVRPKCADYAHQNLISIAIVHHEHLWELDDALTKTFAQIDHCLPQLKALIAKYQADVCIDIAFYQYGTYPTLGIGHENMRKISFLDATISIDPY